MSVLSQKCLPLLQDGGLNKAENMKKLSDIILKETQWSGILFTDREKVIQWQCRAKDEQAIFYQQSMEIQFRKSADRQWKKENLSNTKRRPERKMDPYSAGLLDQFGAISGEESAGRKSDGMDETPVDGQKK